MLVRSHQRGQQRKFKKKKKRSYSLLWHCPYHRRRLLKRYVSDKQPVHASMIRFLVIIVVLICSSTTDPASDWLTWCTLFCIISDANCSSDLACTHNWSAQTVHHPDTPMFLFLRKQCNQGPFKQIYNFLPWSSLLHHWHCAILE